ncbi:hypothetical protein H5410_003500 [Solanum commersonii]|uniref:Uncharacterized protein n=1 Tax=Solanum commersonii TaxID=4109 RepID=A0A9J6B5U1_SOLCO|nr:hypothetical protein H5410_003500 [Solanum commersonii]
MWEENLAKIIDRCSLGRKFELIFLFAACCSKENSFHCCWFIKRILRSDVADQLASLTLNDGLIYEF